MVFVNYNGKVVPETTPLIGADNRGLRYGDGLFETLSLRNGQLVFEHEHFARLWKGLGLLRFVIPKHFTAENLQQEILQLAKKNLHDQSARIRLNVFRGNGGLYDLKNHHPNYIIQTWPLSPAVPVLNSNGLVLGFYEDVKKSCDQLSNLKHNNYLPYALAAIHAKENQWNDAVLLNSFGAVCDTTIANIFAITDGVVYTPALAEGCVAGVMRKMIIQALAGTPWQVVETRLTTQALLNANEVFVSNSIFQLRWVQCIGSSSYTNQVTNSLFAHLQQTFIP